MAGALGIGDCFASRFKLKIRRTFFLFGGFVVHAQFLRCDRCTRSRARTIWLLCIRVRCVRAFVDCTSAMLLATRVGMNLISVSVVILLLD